MTIEEVKAELHWRLVKLRPSPVIVTKTTSVEDIFVNRYYLRDAKCTANDLKHLLDIVLSTLAEGRRFRQVDCLKVLKRIVKQWPVDGPFPTDITDRLFLLYTHYIYSASEVSQWAVSVMLKGRVLRDAQVQWLIEHHQDSDHILNRLLRYPRRHRKIRNWARRVIQDSSALPERRSELLGLLIDRSIPRIASGESSAVVAWAIYYSTAPRTTKVKLLKRILDFQNFWEVVKIAERSNFPEVIEYALGLIEKAVQ